MPREPGHLQSVAKRTKVYRPDVVPGSPTSLVGVNTPRDRGPKRYLVWCPGCDDLHTVDESWGFNNNFNAPTFTGSLKTERYSSQELVKVCHAFIENGKWRFLNDSTHDLAGQTNVPMVELPEWVID